VADFSDSDVEISLYVKTLCVCVCVCSQVGSRLLLTYILLHLVKFVSQSSDEFVISLSRQWLSRTVNYLLR